MLKKSDSIVSLILCVAALVLAPACGSNGSTPATQAVSNPAALTNQADDDADGKVDESDEGVDEDADGRIDEGSEHHDACMKRHGGRGHGGDGHSDDKADEANQTAPAVDGGAATSDDIDCSDVEGVEAHEAHDKDRASDESADCDHAADESADDADAGVEG